MQPQELLIFRSKVEFSPDPQRLDQLRRALNLHHYGAESIPLTVPSEQIPESLRQAHRNLNMVHKFEVWLTLFDNGEIR